MTVHRHENAALASPDHPVLAVDLPDDGRRPFRRIPPELRAVESNLNIANMAWGISRTRPTKAGFYRSQRS